MNEEQGEPILFQSIPGQDREDREVVYNHSSRLVRRYGDDIGATNETFLRASSLKDDAANARKWCSDGDKRGENYIRTCFAERDHKVSFWQKTLKNEIVNLSNTFLEVTNCLRYCLKTIQYLDRPFSISNECKGLRTQIEKKLAPDDKVNFLLGEEANLIISNQGDMRNFVEELREYQRKLQDTRNSLMTDAEGKSLTLVITKSCQHNEVLLNLPFLPEDRITDPYEQHETPEAWELQVSNRVDDSIELRRRCVDCCRKAENTMACNQTKLAAAWERTKDALEEEAQRDEYYQDKTKKQLQVCLNDITQTQQRIASLYTDLEVQKHRLQLILWRNQRLTYRSKQEHLKDGPMNSVHEEESQVRARIKLLLEDIQKNDELLKDLIDVKVYLDGEMGKAGRKIFIDRDSCLGVRSTVVVDGSDGKFI